MEERFQPRNPDYKARVQQIFDKATFIRDVGIHAVTIEAGLVEAELVVEARHQQQDGYIHAGVQATIADHSAGACAGTLCAAYQIVLSAEFKINLLRAAQGEKLFCRATMLKAGKTLSVVESEVFAIQGDTRKLVSKATVTLALVSRS